MNCNHRYHIASDAPAGVSFCISCPASCQEPTAAKICFHNYRRYKSLVSHETRHLWTMQ